jgi:4-hydroxy-tetrahydrodipicolinate synthase
MTKISGIYAATMSVLNPDLSLNVKNTIEHAEKLIDEGCHGTAIFGSTGQSQLIPISEKIELLNELSKSKYKSKHLIGTGLNSLGETINFMKIAISLSFNKFLIMPPAYYKYEDAEVIEFYTKIIESVPDCKIILYNFEKLSGYKFSEEIVIRLVKSFPNNIIGCKDSSYNLYESLKLPNFLMFPGSEAKLLRGLEIGCSGCISAVTNVTHSLARKVFDDFENKVPQSKNKKLINVRETFDQYNLISALHSFLSNKDDNFKNILPPLVLLSQDKQKELEEKLNKLEFVSEKNLAA